MNHQQAVWQKFSVERQATTLENYYWNEENSNVGSINSAAFLRPSTSADGKSSDYEAFHEAKAQGHSLTQTIWIFDELVSFSWRIVRDCEFMLS